MAGMDGGARAPLAGGSARVAGVGGSAGDGAALRAKRDYVRRDWAHKLAMVREACRRIVDRGESVTEICRDPRMPGRSTFAAWLTANAELRALVEAAQAEAATLWTARRAYHPWDEAVAAEFLARIEDGRGLREVCAELDMPVHATVTRWLKTRPEFAQAYRQAREAQADRLFDLAWTIARECPPLPGEVAAARLKIQTLKWRVGRLAPRVYGPLKAVAPPPPADSGAEEAEAPTRVVFHVRSWARTPDNRVVETTQAAVGMTPAERQALGQDIAAGRVSLEALERMSAAGEAWAGTGDVPAAVRTARRAGR